MNTFQEYKFIQDFNEAIRIVTKKWKTDFPGYTVEYNDLQSHNLIPRIQDRTDLTLGQIGKIFEKAIEYIIKKNEKGFFRGKAMVEFEMKKSQFKVLIMINPDDKYIRFSTVLSMDMPSKGTIKWNLNEEEVETIVVDFDSI